jgi:hypothetical protein
MASLRPDALMRYRLWVDVVTHGVGLADGLPNPPYICLVMGHFYTVLRYPAGIYGDLAVARAGGATKREVGDILALAWLHAGPFGVNTAAQVGQEFMDEWTSDDGGPGMTWPKGWDVVPDGFRCGVDFEAVRPAAEAMPAGIEVIRSWYLEVQGEVPDHVEFLARHYPLALLAYRARYETSMTGALPAQMIALCQLHLAASWRETAALRRALRMCRHFGVARDHVIQIVTLAQFYLGDVGMDSALTGVDEELETWPTYAAPTVSPLVQGERP